MFIVIPFYKVRRLPLMSTYVTLAEAATYLGVSKATLRNWDRQGKLRAERHPLNNYRAYALADLQQLQSRLPLWADEWPSEPAKSMTAREVRALVSRLHRIIRDSDSNSNIIERFDELTKLLFLKLQTEETDPDLFARVTQESETDYAARIRRSYRDIAERHASYVPAAFRALRAGDQTLIACSGALAQVTFHNVGFDLKGLAYEEMIRNTFDKNDNQQFFTPPQVVEFMVEMMTPVLRGDICDPAAGTGGFLIQVLKSELPYASLTALEIDERLAWVAATNLLAHGGHEIDVSCLRDGGTLGLGAEPLRERFDVILTNPPFGSDFTDATLLETYQLGRNRTNRRRGILFLERCHQLLKPGGRAAIVIDEGVLNGSSTEDVRSFLTENFDIEGIVSLPDDAFLPYASVSASVLFLHKPKKRQTKASTFFARAERIGRKSNGDDDIIYADDGGSRLNSDLPEIVNLYRTFAHDGIVPPTDIAYSTNIRSNFAEEPGGFRLDFRYHHPSRRKSRERLALTAGTLLPLADLCEERNQPLIPSTELEDQMITYTGLAHIESRTGVSRQIPTPANSLKSAVKRYEPGDILFAKMRPNLRKVALMDGADGGYTSAECIVLTVRKNESGEPRLDPLLLSALLRSDLVYGQIMHLIAGIGRPRLSSQDLRRVMVPVPPQTAQKHALETYRGAVDDARKQKTQAAALIAKSVEAELLAVEQLAEMLF